MDIKRQYNGFAQHYLAEQQRYFGGHEDVVRTWMVSQLPDIKGKKLLDIGCGGGRDIELYESMGAEVYGVEPAEEMLAEAKKLAEHPDRFVLGDWEQIPFPDRSFDIAVARFSLHYQWEFDKAYAEAARVLKSGAPLICAVDHPFSSREKKAVYGKKELITIPLYNNTVELTFPTHTLSEYFSDAFFRQFTLQHFNEGEEEKKAKLDFMGFVAVRK